MPRNKETVNALGKSWSIVDIDNLEKAVNLLTKLNSVLDNFADSNSNAIDDWLNKTQDIEKSLKDMNITLKKQAGVIDKGVSKEYQKEAQQALLALNTLKQQNKELEKADKIQKQTIRDRQKIIAQEKRQNSFSNYGIKNLGSWFTANKTNNINYRDKLESNRQKIISSEAKAIQNQLASRGHIISEDKAKEIATRRLDEDRLKGEASNKLVKEQEKNTKKLGLAGDVLNEAGKLLSSVANKFVELFFQGAKRQADTYNSTYSDVVTRLGVDRGTYYRQWTNANRNIKSAGLIDNIGTSAVMEQWDTLAKTGMSEAQVFESALDTVVTQKIVPYLDTTSKEFSIINGRLNNNFVKDIRGINRLNKEIAGNNYATQDMLNTIIDEVQPISDEALENLAQGSAEVTAFVNSLIGQGVSEDVAKSYGKELFQLMNYSDKLITTGSTSEKRYVIDNLVQGINYEDPTQWNDAMGVMVNSDMQLMSNAPGYGNARQGLTTNIVGSALGLDPSKRRAMYTLKNNGITGSSLVNQTNLTKEQFVAASQQETQNLVDGIYNTEKEMQELTMENISTEMAQLQAKMGAVGDLIIDAIKGIGTILITKIFTDGIGNIAGMIGGTGGKGLAASGGLVKTIGSGLAATGPIGLALGATVAAIGVTSAILAGIAQDEREKARDSVDKGGISKAGKHGVDAGEISAGEANEAAYGVRAMQMDNLTGNSKSLNYVGISDFAADLAGKSDSQQLRRQFNWSSKEEAEKYGIKKKLTQSGAKEAQEALDRFRRKKQDKEYNTLLLAMLNSWLQEKGHSNVNKAVVGIALQIAANYQGLAGQQDIMGPINSELGMPDFSKSHSKMADALHTSGITTYDQLMSYYNLLSKLDLFLMAGDGYSYLGFPNQDGQKEAIKKDFNLLRRGLNRVPYDNYPALLHEDEAVLTASTANELRTLVSEYRDTKQQSYNFETIIQDQTLTLCNKIDELIRAVQGDSYSNLTDTDINTRNSMKKMKSVFSLLKD